MGTIGIFAVMSVRLRATINVLSPYARENHAKACLKRSITPSGGCAEKERKNNGSFVQPVLFIGFRVKYHRRSSTPMFYAT